MKTRVTHTPGPYFCRRHSDGVDDIWEIVADGEDRPLVDVHFWDEPDEPEVALKAEANARLFAAAPELLDALRLADAHLAFAAPSYDSTETYRKARAALAKADGSNERNADEDGREILEGIPDFNHIRYDMLILPPDIERAFKTVIEHYWPDEKRDFDGMSNKERKNHIARELHMIRTWLFCPTGHLRYPLRTGK